MIEKHALFHQPAGLGDIFWLQKAATMIADKLQCRILWPVSPVILKTCQYILNDVVDFISTTDFDVVKSRYNIINEFNFRHADQRI